MCGGPTAVGIVGIAHIISRREMPLPVFSHQERDVLGVIVLIASHDIEHYSTEQHIWLMVKDKW